MSRRHRSCLTGISHHLAFRVRELAKPYIARDEEVPRDLLANEFQKVCEDYTHRGGELSTSDMEKIANKYLPRALAQLDRRQKEGQPQCI